MSNTRNLPAVQPANVPRVLDSERMTFGDMLAMGSALVTTGFLPDHIKTGAQAAAIIATGRELGMQPMRALRSLNMVKGKVTENADSQLARFKTDGGRAKFEVLTHERAVLHLVHPNGDEHTEEFTMRDAQAAGLVSAGGMYQKHAKAMLRSRVITAGLKSIGWEGGAGTYDPDELAPPRPLRDAANEQRVVRGEPTPTGVDHDTGEVLYDDDVEIMELEGSLPMGDNMDEPVPVPSRRTASGFDPDEPLKFGKHKGRSLRDIAMDDPKYVGWYYRTEKEKTKTGERYAKTAEWVGDLRAFVKSLAPDAGDPGDHPTANARGSSSVFERDDDGHPRQVETEYDDGVRQALNARNEHDVLADEPDDLPF